MTSLGIAVELGPVSYSSPCKVRVYNNARGMGIADRDARGMGVAWRREFATASILAFRRSGNYLRLTMAGSGNQTVKRATSYKLCQLLVHEIECWLGRLELLSFLFGNLLRGGITSG